MQILEPFKKIKITYDDPARGNALDLLVTDFSPPVMRVSETHFDQATRNKGRLTLRGRSYDIAQGDSIVLPPGKQHVIENTGAQRLYCLTVMVPNEGFAEMIRNGQPMALDQADSLVITGPLAPRP